MNKVNILEAVEITKKRVKPFNGSNRYLATGDLSLQGRDSFANVTYENKPSRADLLVEDGNLIIARMKEINKVLLIAQTTEDLIVSTGFLTLKPQEKFYATYLFHYFRSPIFQREKDRLCSGATQKAINNGSFANLQVPEYPLAAQKTIANELVQAENLCHKRKEQLALLDDYLKSVFLEMFSDPVINKKSGK